MLWAIAVGALVLVADGITAQDTYECPDGWFKHEIQGQEDECFLFGKYYEKVTHDDARAICESHQGWLAEVEHGPRDNYWIVSVLVAIHEAGNKDNGGQTKIPFLDDQWWIGARSYEHHDEHQPGVWRWDNTNATVEWFDWADGQPNDWRQEQCLTFIRFTDIWGRDTYKWNDWGCDDPSHFICEKEPILVADN